MYPLELDDLKTELGCFDPEEASPVEKVRLAQATLSFVIRTTYATMLFLNGANIRVVNELLGHEKLSTTALYTPLGLDDVRRALRLGHPRA